MPENDYLGRWPLRQMVFMQVKENTYIYNRVLKCTKYI